MDELDLGGTINVSPAGLTDRGARRAELPDLDQLWESRGAPLGVVSGSIGYSAGGPVWLDAFRSKRPPSPLDLVNAYKAISYACVRLNMFGVARVPLRLYARTGPRDAKPRRHVRSLTTAEERHVRKLPHLARTIGPDDQVQEVKEHPFLDALDAPNDYFDGNLLLCFLTACLDVIGSAYIYPERPTLADGTADVGYAATKLWPLQSQYVFAVKGAGEQLLRSYRYFGDTYTPEKLVRMRYISLRDPYLSAYAPLHACFEQVGLGDYYTAAVESFMKSGLRSSGAFTPADSNVTVSEQDRKRQEIDLNNRFTGGRSGHIMVLNGAYKWNPMTLPPSDLGGLEISKWERLLVANCFDVPISLLQAEDTNRAVASEGTHQHQYYAIAPRCVIIAAALTHQLARPVDRRLFFAFDNPVDRDEERRAKVFDLYAKAGRTTINEDRAEDGLPPFPWGDEPWFPQTLVQPSAAEEMRAQRQQAREAMANAAKLQLQPKPDGEEEPNSVEPPADPGERHAPTLPGVGRGLEGEELPPDGWEQVKRVLSLIEADLASDHGSRAADGGDRLADAHAAS